jgi:hypothetical protein
MPAQYSHIASHEPTENMISQNQPFFVSVNVLLTPLNGSNITVNTTEATEKMMLFINRGEMAARFHFPITVDSPDAIDEVTANV